LQVKRKPTLKDVAQLAGVSTATVSYVINEKKIISKEVKERIFEAIESLNYIPNNLAQSLKNRETRLIGLLISDIANPFFPQVIRGIEHKLAMHNYNILLSETNSDPGKEKENLKMLLGRRVEGLIVSLAGREVNHFSNIDTPIVFFNRVPDSEEFHKVQVDNFKAAYLATEHLILHGYKRIAIISGPEYLNVGRDRMLGYRQAMLDHGLPILSKYTRMDRFSVEYGYNAMEEFMSLSEPPEAVFTCNNALTLGAFRFLKEKGYLVPKDVALVAYDDTDWATLVDPPLTVVRYPMYEMGVRIGELILQSIQEKVRTPAQNIRFDPELVIRRSCGC